MMSQLDAASEQQLNSTRLTNTKRNQMYEIVESARRLAPGNAGLAPPVLMASRFAAESLTQIDLPHGLCDHSNAIMRCIGCQGD
jgi:hypothetical protein